MNSVGSLPHKFKCEDLVEGQLYLAYIIGHRTWDLYVAAKPPGKDHLQFFGADGFFRALDIFYCWTSDLAKVEEWMDKFNDAEFDMQEMLAKRREKEKRKKEGRQRRK